MIVLPNTTTKLQIVLAGAVTTNQLQCDASWRDITATPTYKAGSSTVVTNNTTDVDFVIAPAASTERLIDLITIYNADTASATIIIKKDMSGVGTTKLRQAIPPQKTLCFTSEKGFFFAGDEASSDPWIEQAKRVIFADYGVNVSLEAKNKHLLKFGRSVQVQTTPTSLMTLPTGTFNETYVASNLINSIISTSAADGEIVTVEGHSISGGNLTFVTQTVTLNGQTAVALGTALARATRVYNNDATELAGIISVTETDTYTNGVPDTAAKVHLQTRVGQQESEDAATSISSSDYWVVTSFYADMLEKTATTADVFLEVRLSGKVFRIVANITCSTNHRADFQFKPYLIIPPNSDVRLRAIASANGKDVSGGIEGVLLKD